jgi:hypothetical protein
MHTCGADEVALRLQQLLELQHAELVCGTLLQPREQAQHLRIAGALLRSLFDFSAQVFSLLCQHHVRNDCAMSALTMILRPSMSSMHPTLHVPQSAKVASAEGPHETAASSAADAERAWIAINITFQIWAQNA